MRPHNPKVDPESPAAKIAAKFDRKGNPRASALAKALGLTPSTVQRWLEKGSIPNDYHPVVVSAGRAAKITLRPEDFVDARAFEKSPKPSAEALA